MNEKIEKDELLNKLRQSAKNPNAPILSEEILFAATKSEQRFGPRKLHTPKIILNLVGGAAVLAAVFALTLNPSQTDILKDLEPNGTSGSASIAMGNFIFTEEELLVSQKLNLAYWGQKAVGNYVSNSPETYVDNLWPGRQAYWIFVVADGVYMPNERSAEIRNMFKAENLDQFSGELSKDSTVRGIKFLIQEQGVGGALYPLVVREDQESSFYKQVRDILLSDTYTQIPLN